jgi:hypothetical protein
MKIESSSLTLQSSYQSLVRESHHERLSVWSGHASPEITSSGQLASRISISEAARTQLQWDLPSASVTTPSIQASNDPTDNDPFLSLIKSMVEMLTGAPVKTFSSADLPTLREMPPLAQPPAANWAPASSSTNSPSGPGMRYEASHLREEFEQLNLAAEGVVRTSDGQEIHFSLQVQVERSYREEQQISVTAGNVPRKDPLVLNFNGTAAQLTDQMFRFDLDGDGRADLLPGLAAGSGFLVFDRNGNGRIDDGSELFGPRSNFGFAELALLDADQNRWLDEADPLFKLLGVWRPADSAIHSLTELGVGALGLANIATPFTLRDAKDAARGAIRDTSIFLQDNGNPGLLQEIDLDVG